MLANLCSSAVMGVDALDVHVEVDVGAGLPAFDIVGLPGASVREARDRVRTAVKNAGYAFPLGRVTVNLAPAHLPKAGTFYDLPIAIGVLIASGQIRPAPWVFEAHFIGELSLDGSIRPVRGTLCVAASLVGRDTVLVAPGANRAEIDAVPGLSLVTADTLGELVRYVSAEAAAGASAGPGPVQVGTDRRMWRDVRGQETAKRCLQIALAGGHHALLIGPPGAGKTMLAQDAVRFSSPLSVEESIDVSRVYSVAGLLTEAMPLIRRRPFRSPHHTVTRAGLLGGGAGPRPGEVSLAHRGVLFLDELAEFSRAALEGLREPLEEGVVTLSRASGTYTYPADFTLIAAMNPCPCGFIHDGRRMCTCTSGEIERHRRKLSGPLLDRMDLFVLLTPTDPDVLLRSAGDETHCVHRSWIDPIDRAEEVQRQRFRTGRRRNVHIEAGDIERYCPLDDESRALLTMAGRERGLSARAIHRSLKVARTIADIDGEEEIRVHHVAESLAFRRDDLGGLGRA